MLQSTSKDHGDPMETERPPMATGPMLIRLLLLYSAACSVFALDIVTPLGFSVSMLYVPICLTALWLRGWRFAVIMGGLCSGLTIAGLFLSPPGGPVIWSVVNRGIGFTALWSLLWVGRLFVERTVELERTKAGLSREVEQRKQVEQALLTINDQLESRIAQRTAQLQTALDRWALVTQATHDGVYDWDLTTHRVVYSPHWKAMHGFSLEDEEDESPEQWSERIHSNDRSRVLGHLDEYLARKRQEFREEYRIRRCDGRWIWVLDRGIALWNDAGQAVRLVGSEKDITERKQAEDLLRRHEAQLEELTAKLLSAQERERQRLARELHDDFTQRLAVLAVDIGSLERSFPSDPSLRDHLQHLRQAAGQLAHDAQAFAYQLHPSLLEHLGLEAAVRDHVDEFRRRTGLFVRYVRRDIPKSLPLDTATCLYRVTQECLQNIHKHAEASEVLVRLLSTPNGVGVCIRDNGKGFSQNPDGVPSPGLGLISMQERIHLMNGSFRIRTQPGKGTEVHAWVPVPDLVHEVAS
jgi:PAS domain S-box-containing protein